MVGQPGAPVGCVRDRSAGASTTMRHSLFRAAPLAALALAACPAHTAFGPGSDERLESSVNEKASREGGGDVAGVSCTDLLEKFRDSRSEDKPETERLKVLVEVYAASRDRREKLDSAIDRNPDLIYTTDGESTKSAQEGCRAAFADIRSDLDRYLREVVDMPIIQELQGREMVNVARLDFGLVRNAIATLDPDDKEAMLARVEAAERKVGGPKRPAPGTRN